MSNVVGGKRAVELNAANRFIQSLTTRFVFVSQSTLLITGIAKIWTAFSQTKILQVPDPLLGIALGHLMLAVGVLELVTASICLFAKSQALKLGLIAWLATNFVVYRLGLWWIGWQKPCSCMGNLTDALHIRPEVADNIMKAILAYLFIGSYGLLICQWRAAKSRARMEGGGLKMEPAGQA